MLTVTNPFTQKVIQQIPFTPDDTIAIKIQQAYDFIKKNKQGIPKHQRIKILSDFLNLVHKNKSQLIHLAIEEGGKPNKDTLIEFQRATEGIELAIQAIKSLHGEEIPMGITPNTQNKLAFTTHEPIGVVLAISAFNHPINLIIHQAITAIAAGCPVLIKPSLSTPLSALLLVDLLYQAGLAKHLCSCIICPNSTTEQLVGNPLIHFVSFIGAAEVGWQLRSKLAPGTRCALEHGGVAPVIITPNAQIDKHIDAIAKGAFYHAGQVCVSVQKIYIHESSLKMFLATFIPAIQQLKIGNPQDPQMDIGPIIHTDALKRIHEWVSEAIEAGAELICGGKIQHNSCYAATVLLNPNESAKVSSAEIFGPVVSIYTYTDIYHAVQKANQLDFHFQAAVFTQDINEAFKISDDLDAATVLINEHTSFRADWMPFGGRNHSGLGVASIMQTVKDYSTNKLSIINLK